VGQVERVTKVWVWLGPLAGVSADELQFGFTIAATGTPFAAAQLLIEPTPVIVYCPHCARPQTPTQAEPLTCPTCASPAVQVVQGKELVLHSIEFVQSPP
jgi:hydrogenase nickel insertion protein HypA